jgi:hypothetical protein
VTSASTNVAQRFDLVDPLLALGSTRPQRAAYGYEELTYSSFALDIDDATLWETDEERVAVARVRSAFGELDWLDGHDVDVIAGLIERRDARWVALVDAAEALAAILRVTVACLEAPRNAAASLRAVLEAIAPLAQLHAGWSRVPAAIDGLAIDRIGRPLRRRYVVQADRPSDDQVVAAFGTADWAAVSGADGSSCSFTFSDVFAAFVSPTVAARMQRRLVRDGSPPMRDVPCVRC